MVSVDHVYSGKKLIGNNIARKFRISTPVVHHYNCAECLNGFPTKVIMLNHIKTIQICKCRFCLKYFPKRDIAVEHSKKCSQRDFAQMTYNDNTTPQHFAHSVVCSAEKFPVASRTHRNLIDENKFRFICQLCGLVFENMQEISGHSCGQQRESSQCAGQTNNNSETGPEETTWMHSSSTGSSGTHAVNDNSVILYDVTAGEGVSKANRKFLCQMCDRQFGKMEEIAKHTCIKRKRCSNKRSSLEFGTNHSETNLSQGTFVTLRPPPTQEIQWANQKQSMNQRRKHFCHSCHWLFRTKKELLGHRCFWKKSSIMGAGSTDTNFEFLIGSEMSLNSRSSKEMVASINADSSEVTGYAAISVEHLECKAEPKRKRSASKPDGWQNTMDLKKLDSDRLELMQIEPTAGSPVENGIMAESLLGSDWLSVKDEL